MCIGAPLRDANAHQSQEHAVRTLVVWCPDWPVVAAGADGEAAAVLFANRVVSCSRAARAEGVAVGMRRREAQGRCPHLVVLDHDPARDARAFEVVAAALETLTPRLEIAVPGQCAFPTRGPSRYFGGDAALATRAHELVAATGTRAQVGIADGPMAARLAARASTIVPVGETPAFLAPLPLTTLERPELVDVLSRLGLCTLGDLAALPARDVLGRFGTDGELAHRLASGLDERPPVTSPPAPDLAVQAEFDPPAERIEVAAFVARSLADELHQRLSARGETCTRLLVAAETEHGERFERLWRLDVADKTGSWSGTRASGFTAGAIADRTRWQLDGWINGSVAQRPTAGIALLRLVPDEVVPASGRQLGFWGGAAGADERVIRAVARVEGLLGPEAVTVPEWRGGRRPDEQVTLVPAGAIDLASPRPAAAVEPAAHDEPWPGRLPSPSPASVPADAVMVDVVDARGQSVRVSGRTFVSASPARLTLGTRSRTIVAWAGPWPVDERWWDPDGHRRQARFQLVTDDGVARLAVVENQHWWVAATYD
jgi:protein ImuB